MKPETRALIRDCQRTLAEQDEERIQNILETWVNTLLGTEDADVEEIDALCSLFSCPIQSQLNGRMYSNYSAWLASEGEEDFAGVIRMNANLSQIIRDLSLKQMDGLLELAYRAEYKTAEAEGREKPPTCPGFFSWLMPRLTDPSTHGTAHL